MDSLTKVLYEFNIIDFYKMNVGTHNNTRKYINLNINISHLYIKEFTKTH